MRTSRPGPSRGFTLVEVLVALTILSLALAALFQAFGGGLRGVIASRDYLGAAAEARSIVQRVGVDIPVAPGVLTGEFEDGNRWEVAIDPFAGTDLRGGATGGQLALFAVKVTIAAGDRPLLSIATLRLGPPQ